MQAAIFGSSARGSSDSSSDFDVIAVIEDAAEVDKEALRARFNGLARRKVGLSIYSVGRLKAMWLSGSPFAWHLHLEARPFPGFRCEFLNGWGCPESYRSAAHDCEMMVSIIDSAGERLRGTAINCECYEAGLLYVGARNIGMFASSALTGAFDFSRLAPFSLQDVLPFPMTRSEFDVLVRARHATTRGSVVPELDRKWLISASAKLSHWASSIVVHVNRRNCGI